MLLLKKMTLSLRSKTQMDNLDALVYEAHIEKWSRVFFSSWVIKLTQVFNNHIFIQHLLNQL